MKHYLKEQKDKQHEEKIAEQKKNAVMAKKIAKLKGDLGGTGSDDADAPGMADYRQVISSYLKRNYRIPEAYNYESAVTPTVSFTVTAAGEIENLKIIRSSNHPALDHYVLQSVQDAASGFPKPPAAVVGLEIQVNFFLH